MVLSTFLAQCRLPFCPHSYSLPSDTSAPARTFSFRQILPPPQHQPRIMFRTSCHLRSRMQRSAFLSGNISKITERFSFVIFSDAFGSSTSATTGAPTTAVSRTASQSHSSQQISQETQPPPAPAPAPTPAPAPADPKPQSEEPFPFLKSRLNVHAETQDIWFDPMLASVTPFSEPQVKYDPIPKSKRKVKPPAATASVSGPVPLSAEKFAVSEQKRSRERKKSEAEVKAAVRDAQVQASLLEIDLEIGFPSDSLLSLQASLDDQIDAQVFGHPPPPPPQPTIQFPTRGAVGKARRVRGTDTKGGASEEGGGRERQVSIQQLLRESILTDRVPAGRDPGGGEEEVPAGRDVSSGNDDDHPAKAAANGRVPGGNDLGGTKTGSSRAAQGGSRSLPGGTQRAGDGAGNGYVSLTGPLAHVACRPVMVKRGKKLPECWDGAGGTVALVDKPKGFRVQVGHAGTLDPMATGLLVVCIGKATKLADSYQAMTKVYSGVMRLGEATASYDAEEPVCERLPWEHISDDALTAVTSHFLGDIMQKPPMFSAIKVKGQKMYEKARRGEHVDLPPRHVAIMELRLTRNAHNRQDVDFYVHCSKGTYIRSLAVDIGRELGTCAHLVALRREKIGDLSVENAFPITALMDAYTEEQAALTSFNAGMWANRETSELDEKS